MIWVVISRTCEVFDRRRDNEPRFVAGLFLAWGPVRTVVWCGVVCSAVKSGGM